jgi:hypothetical protein
VVTLYVPGNFGTLCGTTCINITTPSTVLASWKFENNLLDSGNVYNGYVTNGASYTSGYVNQALIVTSTQYMIVSSSFLTFASRSFTIEGWIFVTSITSSVDYGIFGQCQSTSTTRLCLHFLIRSSKLYMGFLNDDIAGATTLPTNVWTHVACMFDLTSNTKSVYLNGILDGSTTSGSYYQGTTGVMNVGYAITSGSVTPLPGYIDQVNTLIIYQINPIISHYFF